MNTALYRKMHTFYDNRRISVGLFSRTRTDSVINRGEGGPRTGSSIHPTQRPITKAELGLDGSMIRWLDIPIIIARHYVDEKNRLAIWQDDAAKTYVIDIKRVIKLMGEEFGKNAGGKYEGKSHYVVENKCRKNVRNRPRHYVYENKGI